MRIVFSFILLTLVTLSCKDSTIDTKGQAIYNNINISQAKALMASNPDLIILDVRTPNETNGGTLPNALKLDYKNTNFDTEIDKLDRSKSYLIYCKAGGRSTAACKKMNAAGFTDLSNMKDGYSAWK